MNTEGGQKYTRPKLGALSLFSFLQNCYRWFIIISEWIFAIHFEIKNPLEALQSPPLHYQCMQVAKVQLGKDLGSISQKFYFLPKR